MIGGHATVSGSIFGSGEAGQFSEPQLTTPENGRTFPKEIGGSGTPFAEMMDMIWPKNMRAADLPRFWLRT
jgi:hypothetical protein